MILIRFIMSDHPFPGQEKILNIILISATALIAAVLALLLGLSLPAPTLLKLSWEVGLSCLVAIYVGIGFQYVSKNRVAEVFGYLSKILAIASMYLFLIFAGVCGFTHP